MIVFIKLCIVVVAERWLTLQKHTHTQLNVTTPKPPNIHSEKMITTTTKKKAAQNSIKQTYTKKNNTFLPPYAPKKKKKQ